MNDQPILEPVKSRPVYLQLALPISIIIAALLISGTIIYSRLGTSSDSGANSGAAQAEKPVDIKLKADDHILGNKNSKVAIFVFDDFQCPFCRRFYEDAYTQIKKDYIDTGKAYLVFRHFPLSFHPAAIPSAQAVECANESGKFWELHNKIFDEQAKKGEGTITFTTTDIKKWASQIGLGADFVKCLDANKYTDRINEDQNYGTQISIDGTPTIFVNGVRIVGAQPYSVFKQVIDTALNKKSWLWK